MIYDFLGFLGPLAALNLPSFMPLNEFSEVMCLLGHSYKSVLEKLLCCWTLSLWFRLEDFNARTTTYLAGVSLQTIRYKISKRLGEMTV